MPHPFPAEILDFIVELVSCDDGKNRIRNLLSLCQSSRVLLPISQRRLYRDITVYPHSSHARSSYHSEAFRKSRCVAKAISGKPYLGAEVQKLTCKVTTVEFTDDDENIADIIFALQHMTKIQELSITHQNLAKPDLDAGTVNYFFHLPAIAFSSINSPLWKMAIRDLSSSSLLDRVVIHNIQQYSSCAVPISANLRHLELLNASLDTSVEPYVTVS